MGAHVKFDILIGVLLSWVLVAVHEVAFQWTPSGKMGPPPPFGAWPFAAGLAAGLFIGVLPRRARRIGQAMALGAFAGLVGAMVSARLSFGFVAVYTPAHYLRGMTRSLGLAIPLGSLIGAVCGLLYEHLTLSGPGKPKEPAPHPTAESGVWDREMDQRPTS